MDLRIPLLALAAACLTQCAGDYASAKPLAQYGIVKLQADANILRMRVFLTSLEVHSTLAENAAAILGHLATLQVPAESLASLDSDLSAARSTLMSDLQASNVAADALVELMNEVNQDVAAHPERLEGDLAKLQAHLGDLSATFVLTEPQVAAMEQRVEQELVGLVGPEVQLVRDLNEIHRAVMTSRQVACDQAKVATDGSAIEATSGLQALIDQI